MKNTGYTGHRPGDLPPVFDLERGDVDPYRGKCPPHSSVDDAKVWLDKVEVAFGWQPIIYTQKSFLDECMGSTTWTMWQYTNTASRDGIRSNVTADVFNGTQSDLDALANR